MAASARRYCSRVGAAAILSLALSGCGRAPQIAGTVPLKVDELGCAVPQADKYTSANSSLKVAQAEIGKLKTPEVTYSSTAQVINLLSQAATDKVLLDYYECRVTHDPGFGPDQRFYFRSLRIFMEAKPTAAEILEWQKVNPLPASRVQNEASAPTQSPSDLSAISRLSPGQRLKTSLEAFTMSSDRRRATVSINITNTSAAPISLALENNGQVGTFAGPKVALSDGNASTWYVQSVVGLDVVPCCYRTLSEVGQDRFSFLGPGEQIRLVIAFNDDNGGIGTVRGYGATAPAASSSYAFTAVALAYGETEPQRFSIRLPSMRAPR